MIRKGYIKMFCLMILRDATPFQQQEDKTTLSLNAIIR